MNRFNFAARRARLLISLIGALAGFSGCAAATTRPVDLFRRAFYIVPPAAIVGSEEFECQLDRRTHSRRTYRNTAEILENGREAYPAMLAAIRSARRDVNLTVYTFAPDQTGGEFAEALADAAKRGVRVRVIFDAFGSMKTRARDLQIIVASGGELRIFNAAWTWTAIRFNNRAHRKILTVDGETAIIGGLNIADQHQGDNWRDFMLRVSGDAVAAIEQNFAQTWQQAGKGWFDKKLPMFVFSWLKGATELPFRPLRTRDAKFPPAPSPNARLPIRVVAQDPYRFENDILNLFEYAIISARRNVYLCAPYFIPPPRLFNALRAAARRGVTVKILTQGVSDIPQIPPFSLDAARELELAGAEIYAWTRGVLHGKYLVIDDEWLTIGSANADSRSLILNYETNLALTDRRFAQEFARLFLADTAQSPRFFDFFPALKPPPFYLRWLRHQF